MTDIDLLHYVLELEQPWQILQIRDDLRSRQSAPGSDPGLCVVATTSVSGPKALIGFGQTAKDSVLTKSDAYGLAQRLGIHLSEHGGTGQGVIGALAGAGLRLIGGRSILLVTPDHLGDQDAWRSCSPRELKSY